MVLPMTAFGSEEMMRAAVIRTELLELTTEIVNLNKYRDYYTGAQKLAFGTEKFKERFGSVFEGFRDNWCEVVVDATADKLEMTGIQIGRTKDDIEAHRPMSERVWETLLDNDIDDQQTDIHAATMIEGRTTAILWPDEDLGFAFDWNPAQLVRVRYDEENPKKISWATKRWRDPVGKVYVTYYTPDFVWKYTDTEGADAATKSDQQLSPMDMVPEEGSTGSLVPRRVPGEDWPLKNPFSPEVPVIEFTNKNGMSALSDVIPMQDAINYIWIQMMVAGEYMAHPQRVITTRQQEPSGGWHNDPGRMWHLEPMVDPDGKVYMPNIDAFPTMDPSIYIKIIDKMVEDLANTTKTPMRMFRESDRGGRGDAPSGESLKVEDKPLLDKVKRLTTRLGNRWYRVVKLGTQALMENPKFASELEAPSGFDIDKLPRGEVQWLDQRLEYRTAALADAQKMIAIGMPMKMAWEEAGFTPEEIEEAEGLLEEQKELEFDEEEKRAKMQAEHKPEPAGFGGGTGGAAGGKPAGKPAPKPGKKPPPK